MVEEGKREGGEEQWHVLCCHELRKPKAGLPLRSYPMHNLEKRNRVGYGALFIAGECTGMSGF